MIVDFGYYAMLAALVLTSYAVFAGITGIKRNSANLILSARNAHLATFGMVIIAYLALTYAFLTNDFSIKFVANNSSTDLPLFYKITAVWGGLDGSLLLWQMILSFFTAIIAIRYQKQNKEILPHILVILGFSSIFLLFLLIGWSNPFLQNFPTVGEGRGLNPLLQNPGMVIHPPTLYLGYVGFNVPFAFAMASLWAGKESDDWILATRRWTLVSWFFLTTGMILGGNWAYIELGWGGYWAWDPVENASLMPWLTGTAYLHSVIVQEKRNRLKLWNMLLLIATFALTILGTFITRSGVLNSVHAFSKSNIGPAFLVFIAIILVASHTLVIMKPNHFRQPEGKAGAWSKENGFLLNNVFFVGMCFTVLYGTIFPLLAEGLFDKKLSIQAPFFNSIMLPLGIFLVLTMGITQVLGWKNTSQKMLKKNLLIPSVLSIVVILAGLFAFHIQWQFAFLSAMGLFAGWTVSSELFKSFSRAKAKGEQTFIAKIWTDKRKRGGMIIHLGMVVLIIGFCGNFYGAEKAFTLYPNQVEQVGKYKIKYLREVNYQSNNARHVGADLTLEANGKYLGNIRPVKAFYPTRPEPMTEVAIYRTMLEDLYISLSSLNEDGSVTLNVYINPLVNLVWGSMGFFIVGMFYSIAYKPAQLRKKKGEA
ncbi:MAG: heme lyase CcmF/NrfE family subunit [SAR324 cluster bacterium]|nr:heme lyase CcmF/NrfE family subunit [SAR324 cluster bacterium]